MEQKGQNVYEVHGLTDVPVIFHHDMACRSARANWHENVELLLFTKGEGTVVCDDCRTPVAVGDLCIIDSGLLHRVESEDIVFYDCLIVDESFCHKNGLFPNTVSFPRRIRSAELTEEYNKVAKAFASKDPYRIADLRAATLRLMVSLMRSFSRPANEADKVSNSPIRAAIGYIRSHYGEPLELNRLASEVNLSKYHFIRKFKAATGQTVISYINTVRVEHAERLLREGGRSVAEVAQICGFVSHSYFSKVFFRLRGVLPSEIK